MDQLFNSAGDQQRLQAVLSVVGSKSTILTLIQEVKAQSEVSGIHKPRDETAGRLWRDGEQGIGQMLGLVCCLKGCHWLEGLALAAMGIVGLGPRLV